MADIITPPLHPQGISRQIFTLTGLNLNSGATDQVFIPTFGFTSYRITEIWLTNASATLAAMAGTLAIRTATAGGGTAIVSAQNLQGLVTPQNMIVCTITNSDIRSTNPLYARLSAALGSAATCDVYINGIALT
jgi:hypothetical protein